MKLDNADRIVFLCDPDFFDVPVQGLISKEYAAALTQEIDARAAAAEQIREGNPHDYEGEQTTHYSVLDAQGNAIAVTYTLNTNFGSGIVVPGTGIRDRQTVV